MSTPAPPFQSLEELEEFLRSRSRSLSTILPSIFLGISSPPENQQSGESPAAIVMVLRRNSDSESLLRDLLNKDGPAPASKASIEAMPVVKVTEEGMECSICLTEYEVGGEVKEMPCKHRYHSDCIVKWLGIHGSCPVCRYKMPEREKKIEEGGDSVVEEFLVYIGRVGWRGSNSGPGTESGPHDMESETNS